MSTLIEFGNKYPRIRSHAFEYCARGMVQLFERSRDPFATDPENPLVAALTAGLGFVKPPQMESVCRELDRMEKDRRSKGA